MRTTTINCRVSFIDIYLVFPRNFRIVFLPHTNTVILLERYCGTITEPGLPVIFQAKFIQFRGSVKCRLQTDCGLLFLGLENNGTIIVPTHLHVENNSPQSAFYTDRFQKVRVKYKFNYPGQFLNMF